MLYYELVDYPENKDNSIVINDLFLRPFTPDEETITEVQKLARTYNIVVTTDWYKENLVYDDTSSGEYKTCYSLDEICKGYILKNGMFTGVLICTQSVSSYGMSVNKSDCIGLLFTDGTKAGKTKAYFSHCSTEVEKSETTYYSIQKIQ